MTSPYERFDAGRCSDCERPGLRLWPDSGVCTVCSDRPDPGDSAPRVGAFYE